MKLIDKVLSIKKLYSESVVLIKSGTFYITYNDDAYILGYLMDYQVNDSNKLGFPINSLDKIIDVLDKAQINVYIIDENIERNYSNNHYNDILRKAKKDHFNDLNINLLLDEIKYLLKDNPENISKIRSFISEL